MNDAEQLHRIRHSLAHVLAAAVQALRPGAKLGFGPAIDDGFFYDFILPSPLTEADFPALEAKMRELIARGDAFVRRELSPAEAFARLEAMGEPYKVEYARELVAKKQLEVLTFYESGGFVDLCDGPHVASSKELPLDGFKLRSVAGAYWRGDSSNVMMSRVYAWAFASRAEREAHERAVEEAAERDHKKLGRELEIFAFDDDIGRGLPLWLPNGMAIREELEQLMKDLEFADGYQRVATPHLAREELFFKTGHLPYYADGMFPQMAAGDGAEAERFRLKPMNCPFHHKIFASRPRSYRELPLRLAEYGEVYRYEDSGSVSGLLRVRSMCMNDAHLYCAREQVLEECHAVLRMHRRVYELLGLQNWRVRFSTHSDAKEKFLDDPEGWADAEGLLHQVLDESGLEYFEGPGEAAFYGPKIDFQFKMVTGREETASTLQLDFGVARRLDLSYVGADGALHRPYILHRAPLGTHERFVALLLEHFGGAFPSWLAPVQVRVLPVGEKFRDYARELERELRGRRVRVEVDVSDESFNKKIRSAMVRKIPNVLVVGQREKDERAVTLRRFGQKEQRVLPASQFVDELLHEIRHRLPLPPQGRGLG